MEILISIPPWLHPFMEWFARQWESSRLVWTWLCTAGWVLHDTVATSWQRLSESSYNVWLPVVALALVFWPILWSLTVAVWSAWAWIVWLLASVVLGIVQVGYATYQFGMIALDICGLSMLKTYTIVRTQLLTHIFFLFDRTGSRRRKSRRREWRQRLDQANSYERFLKIRIEAKDCSMMTSTTTTTAGRMRTTTTHSSTSGAASPPPSSPEMEDAALPPRRLLNGRSLSFSGLSSNRHRHPLLDPPPPSDDDDDLLLGSQAKTTIPRTRSFTNSSSNSSNSTTAGRTNEDLSSVLDMDPIVVQELGRQTADLLVSTTRRLKLALQACLQNQAAAADDGNDEDKRNNIRNSSSSSRISNNIKFRRESTDNSAAVLHYLLAGVVKRNHLQLDDVVIQNARSVAESGQYGLSQCTRNVIRNYYEQVEKCLDYVAEAPDHPFSANGGSQQHQHNGSWSGGGGGRDGFPVVGGGAMDRHSELGDRITLVRKMKQNMGRTALMLSGGGAQAMYHLGVIRALVESKLYDDMKVISGTSGGSITAAMCAIKTAEELVADVCVNTVSTDFMLNGEMKKKNIRWFPPMLDMASYWIKHKLLVDSSYFGRTCEHYYKDYTFEEAFLRTGKHVCITVSASRASGDTAQRLLLNHISTPHVTIASAVRASCALPGVMAPAKLTVKNSDGTFEPFEVDGVEWIDGSVQADLPFQRIATLFAVTSFVVSQTNFHVVPFMNKEHHPNQKSFYWQLFQTIEWDIRSRALKLSRLGLFPRLFGQDVSKIFKQKYHGNLTIVPRFTTMQTFGLKALSNPTMKDMDGYLKYSQIATWPYLNAIRDMIRLEKSLDDCLARLESRMRMLNPEIDWSIHDDIESIESGSIGANVPSSGSLRVRISGRPPIGGTLRDREPEKLRRRICCLEQENQKLQDELERLQHVMVNGSKPETILSNDDEKGSQNTAATGKTAMSDGSEGAVWNIVRSSSS